MKPSPIILVTPNDSLKNKYPSIIDNAITMVEHFQLHMIPLMN